MRKLFQPPRKPVIPTGPTSPALTFALEGEMISQEEFSACQRGDMQLVSGKLMNLNQGGSHIPTGMMVALYVRRARKLQVDALLGKPLEETVYVNF